MLRIWICGADGRLGKAIKRQLAGLEGLEYEIFNTDIDELDISNLNEVLNFAELNRPDVIINAASLSNVNECEQKPDLAFKTNALGARNLSIMASKLKAKLVQLSTDLVFDGQKNGKYIEYDLPNPVSIYGKSKLAGESYVKEFTQHHFVIRSSWVFGAGKCFVNDVIHKIKNNEEIEAVEDHYGSPTFAKDLSKEIFKLIQTNEYGTYHICNHGCVSEVELVEKIGEIMNIKPNIKKIKAKDSKLAIKKPNNTALDNAVLKLLDKDEMRDFEDALKEYIKEVC